jgi:hypothetical protein
MLRSTPSNPAIASPPPRFVRRKPGRGQWFEKLFTLPHTAVGIGLLLLLIAEASCALLGRDAPPRQVIGAGPNRKYVDRYTINVSYDHGGRVHWVEGNVTAADYALLTSAAAVGPAAHNRSSPDAALLRVHYLALGPWHYAKVLLRGERPFDEYRPLPFVVLFWDGIIGLLVYQLYVRPWRQRQLYRWGVVSPGRITEVRRFEGKGGNYKLNYAFLMQDGTPVTAKMRLPLFVRQTFFAGDPVRVLHYPRRARPTVIYEHGDYIAEGVEVTPQEQVLEASQRRLWC